MSDVTVEPPEGQQDPLRPPARTLQRNAPPGFDPQCPTQIPGPTAGFELQARFDREPKSISSLFDTGTQARQVTISTLAEHPTL